MDIYKDSSSKAGDPFIIYGHGVLSFFRMIRYLIFTMFIITLLMIPVALFYK